VLQNALIKAKEILCSRVEWVDENPD